MKALLHPLTGFAATVLFALGALGAPGVSHAQNSEPLTIGVGAPMDGPYAPVGDFVRAGVEAAVAAINADGGVLGRQLAVATADDGCTAEGANAAANQLVGAGAALAVGHLCYAASLAAAPVYAENGIVQITPSTRAAALTERRPVPSLFRLAPRADRQGIVAGEFLAGQQIGAQIAILYDGSAYGKGLADAAKAILNDAGRQEAEFTEFQPSAADYTPLAARLIDNAIDVVFLGGGYADVAAIASALRAAGSRATVVTGDTARNAEYLVLAGDGAQGTLVVAPTRPPQTPETEAAAEAAGAGTDVARAHALAAYAAVQVWANAAERADSLEFAPIMDDIAASAHDTVLGTIRFDENGDLASGSYSLFVWQDGALEPL